jgi:hypothetical protein
MKSIEEKLAANQLDRLAKHWSGMKGKRIQPTDAIKLSAMVAKFGKDELEQLAAKNIPFLSMAAINNLMIKHNYNAAKIKGLMKEDTELLYDLYMFEDVDAGEYDYEGDMAKTQLVTISDAAEELHDMLEDDENMPEWCQNKITKAMDYLDSVRDYMLAKDTGEEPGDENPNESVKLDEAATPAMKKAGNELSAYAKKNGGIDKADFMKAADMLTSGKAGMPFIKFVNDQDTEVFEKIITVMSKHMGRQTVEKMFKVRVREELEEKFEPKTAGMKITHKKPHPAGGHYVVLSKPGAGQHVIRHLNKGKVKTLGTVASLGLAKSYIDAKVKGKDPKDLIKKEDVNELNKDTLQKYHKKTQDYMKTALKKDDPKMLKKYGKRLTGSGRANDRLKKTNEERLLEKMGKSSSGYDLYHKDFSSAMKHAYDHAKKKLGIEIDPDEIDDKVAMGPKKPSNGKTNSYRLMGTDKKGKSRGVQIQVANLDNKKYELNMYKEEVELGEATNPLQKRADANKKAIDTGFMKLSKSDYEKEKKRLSGEGAMKRIATTQSNKAERIGSGGSKGLNTFKKKPQNEKLEVSDGMGAWIDDFKQSDAPQFKGKSAKERRDMAIAAYLSAKKDSE